MSIKILRLSPYYTPESISSSHLSSDLNEAYDIVGFEREVYAPTPTRGISDEIRKQYKKIKYEETNGGLVKVHRFSMIKEYKNPVLRALRYIAVQIRQYFYGVNAKGIDLIMSGSTPPTQGVLCGLVKKRLSKKYKKNIPFIYNLQDIFPDSLVGTGLAKKNGIFWKIGRKIENYTYKASDKIIVISEDFKRNIMEKGVPEEKIEIIYNWVDEKAVVPINKEDNPLYSEFNIDKNKFIVLYAGNLGNAQNIDIILESALKLKDNDLIQFVIFGSGGKESEIRLFINQNKLSNLILLPLQPLERVSYVYSLGDLCVVSCKPGLGGAAMPSKTWTIMSTGRAVLANFDEGELQTILESNDCGVFTKAGDVQGFIDAIIQASKEPEKCAKKGENSRKFIINNLTKEKCTAKYVNVILSAINNN